MNVSMAVRPPVATTGQISAKAPKAPSIDRDHDGDNDSAPAKSTLPPSQGKFVDLTT